MNILLEITKMFPESFCILHGWQGLPEYLPSDLDIVVAPDNLPKLEAHLSNFPDARLVNLLQHESTCYYFVLAFQEKGQFRFLQVDAAVDYRRNGLVWFSAEELLEGRRRWKDFWVASPEVEFKYLLVKKVLKGVVPERSAARLKELVEELGEQSRELAEELLGNLDREKVVRWIQRGNWDTLQKHIRELQKALKRQKIRQDPFNPFRYWLPEMKRVWRRWRHPTGLFLVVLGPDGAGKSTLIDRLEAYLSGAFRRTARFHRMPGLFRKKGNGSPVTNPHAKPPRSFLASFLKLVYYFLDYTLGYWLKVRPALAKSTLVLFDRYYDDLLIDPLRYRYGGPMWLARWLSRLVPRPELWLILDVPEDILLRRKQEVPFEVLHRQREAYRRLATKLPNAIILDGSLPPEEVACQTEDAILEYMHERYLTRRSLWFHDSRDEEQCEYLNEALGGVLSEKDKPFLRLSLADGRAYLLPPNSRIASASGLSLYTAQKPRAKLLKGFLRSGLRTGLGRYLLPKVNVDLQELEKHLAGVFDCVDLSLAVSLGTPGPHRKPVVQVLTPEGEVLGYVKVGWNEATNALVQNEVQILEDLRKTSLMPFTVPNVLDARWWNGRYVCVLSPPSLAIQPAHQTLGHDYVEAVKWLAKKELRFESLERSPFWERLKARTKNVQSTFYRHVLEVGMQQAREVLAGTAIPFHRTHGDFTPWNAYYVNGKLYLYDWEYSISDLPAGYDLFHFLVQTLLLLDREKPGVIKNKVLKTTSATETLAYWKQFGVGASVKRSLFLLYLIDRVAFHALEEQSSLKELHHFATLVDLLVHEMSRQ